jgi:hypothetical protein
MNAPHADRDGHGPEPLSAILRDLRADPDRQISIADLVERFGARAFGAILFIFAAACALPLPPGGTTVFGAPLVLLAPQVALGAHAPWLPPAVRRRTISARDLRKVSERLVPWLERIERVSRPRLAFLFGPLGDRVIGIVCTMLALVLILPIPLGNMLPAIAVALLALALTTRDGILAIAGYATTLASTAVLVIAARIVLRALGHLVDLIAAA